MSARSLSDDETIEVVELLGMAVESCRVANTLVSVALERIAGVGTGTSELRRDTARLAVMLSRAPGLAESPTTR